MDFGFYILPSQWRNGRSFFKTILNIKIRFNGIKKLSRWWGSRSFFQGIFFLQRKARVRAVDKEPVRKQGYYRYSFFPEAVYEGLLVVDEISYLMLYITHGIHLLWVTILGGGHHHPHFQTGKLKFKDTESTCPKSSQVMADPAFPLVPLTLNLRQHCLV